MALAMLSRHAVPSICPMQSSNPPKQGQPPARISPSHQSQHGNVLLDINENRRRASSHARASTSGAAGGVAAATASIDSTLSQGFSFSAGGLLFPYYIGVWAELEKQGLLHAGTHVAGASAGSLIAACCKAGLPPSEILEACKLLAADCRANGTRHRLAAVLRNTLETTLPADIHTRCNGNVHIAVTRVHPGGYGGYNVSQWESREDLINTLMTSCHIPWYMDASLVTLYRGVWHTDGGITQFLPPTPTERCAKVCCFPSKQLRGGMGGIDISPDTFDQDWPYSLQTMLGWAFEPAPPDTLAALVKKGRADAAAWAKEARITQQAVKGGLLEL